MHITAHTHCSWFWNCDLMSRRHLAIWHQFACWLPSTMSSRGIWARTSLAEICAEWSDEIAPCCVISVVVRYRMQFQHADVLISLLCQRWNHSYIIAIKYQIRLRFARILRVIIIAFIFSTGRIVRRQRYLMDFLGIMLKPMRLHWFQNTARKLAEIRLIKCVQEISICASLTVTAFYR